MIVYSYLHTVLRLMRSTKWPTCLSPTAISDTRKQELSREKLVSKLFQSIHAFTYSCCSESTELKRIFTKKMPFSQTDEFRNLFAQFGVNNVIMSGGFIMMPDSSATLEGGHQPFQGRIGKLRYLALSIMVATSAVCREVVQLCLEFPLEHDLDLKGKTLSHGQNVEGRARIVFPLLCSHILTHVTAAMFSTCGQARAQSDLFEVEHLQLGASSSNDFKEEKNRLQNLSRKVHIDCHHFIQLGFLARLLQFILGCMKIECEKYLKNIKSKYWEYVLYKITNHLLMRDNDFRISSSSWDVECCQLIHTASAVHGTNELNHIMGSVSQEVICALKSCFLRCCAWSKDIMFSYLADIGLIYQVLAPDAVNTFKYYYETAFETNTKCLDKLMKIMNIEPLGSMLQSELVVQILNNWYEQSRSSSFNIKAMKGFGSGLTYRAIDWPLSTSTGCTQYFANYYSDLAGSKSTSISYSTESPAASELLLDVSNANITSLKTVPLLGGYFPHLKSRDGRRPHIDALPTSYTDLYAKLGRLCPDSEQTALCLICGEVSTGTDLFSQELRLYF